MSISYSVSVEAFVERHYIKTFQKKYKRAWDLTLSALIREFQSFDVLFQKSIAETITDSSTVKICKTEFKVAGTNMSRHSSGNRCIVAIHKDTQHVKILLIYHKNDLSGHNETAAWKQTIRDNYLAYSNLV